jgi:membrane protein implicated in regulation of membrane protease activity
MKSNIVVLLVMAAYFAIATAAYAIWTNLTYGSVEPIGTVVIGLLVILSVFIAYYLYSGMRRSATLPEDREDGNIEDESGEMGFYSPWSWWPLALGVSAAIMFTGLAVGSWVMFIAIPFTLVSLVGFVFEYDRYAHAH